MQNSVPVEEDSYQCQHRADSTNSEQAPPGRVVDFAVNVDSHRFKYNAVTIIHKMARGVTVATSMAAEARSKKTVCIRCSILSEHFFFLSRVAIIDLVFIPLLNGKQ